MWLTLQGGQRGRRVGREVEVAALHHLADHAGQPHALAVFGAVDAHALGSQLANLGRHDHPAAAAEHLNVGAAAFAQQLDHVLEVLDMAALIGADRDALHILLQRGGHHLIDRTVVAEVDHFRPHALQDATHDVDGGVMAVEQAGGGDKTHLVGRAITGQVVGSRHGKFAGGGRRGSFYVTFT